jgi:hypothetical protein
LRVGSRQYVLVFSSANRTDAAFLQPEAFGKAESPEQDGERKQQSHGRKQAYRNLRVRAQTVSNRDNDRGAALSTNHGRLDRVLNGFCCAPAVHHEFSRKIDSTFVLPLFQGSNPFGATIEPAAARIKTVYRTTRQKF